jgi:hypothetical protein
MSRFPMSRRQVLAAAGGTGLLAAAASPARSARGSARVRRARAGASEAGTPEQIHLTWGEHPVNPATGDKGAPTPDYTEFEAFKLVRPRSR